VHTQMSVLQTWWDASARQPGSRDSPQVHSITRHQNHTLLTQDQTQFKAQFLWILQFSHHPEVRNSNTNRYKLKGICNCLVGFWFCFFSQAQDHTRGQRWLYDCPHVDMDPGHLKERAQLSGLLWTWEDSRPDRVIRGWGGFAIWPAFWLCTLILEELPSNSI
jgi:hypothetical protein